MSWETPTEIKDGLQMAHCIRNMDSACQIRTGGTLQPCQRTLRRMERDVVHLFRAQKTRYTIARA